jgi:hypothetical protein
MKVHLQRVEPTRSDRLSAPRPTLAEPPSGRGAGEWSIIEATDEDGRTPRSVGGPHGWRLYAGIALAGAIVAAGLLGRSGLPVRSAPDGLSASAGSRTASPATADPSGTAAADGSAFVFTAPREDAIVNGALADVRAVASRPLGPVRLAVALGGIVIGWTTVDVTAAGPIAVSMPVFAPSIGGRVELAASLAGEGGRAVASTNEPIGAPRSFWLRPTGAIGIWAISAAQDRLRTVVTISGCTPLAYGRISISAQTPDGRTLGTARAAVTYDPADAGSDGGHELGVGSLRASLVLDEAVAAGTTLRLELDWRDESIGLWGASWVSVQVPEQRRGTGIQGGR